MASSDFWNMGALTVALTLIGFRVWGLGVGVQGLGFRV